MADYTEHQPWPQGEVAKVLSKGHPELA
jgi:hypothetical protein